MSGQSSGWVEYSNGQSRLVCRVEEWVQQWVQQSSGQRSVLGRVHNSYTHSQLFYATHTLPTPLLYRLLYSTHFILLYTLLYSTHYSTITYTLPTTIIYPLLYSTNSFTRVATFNKQLLIYSEVTDIFHIIPITAVSICLCKVDEWVKQSSGYNRVVGRVVCREGQRRYLIYIYSQLLSSTHSSTLSTTLLYPLLYPIIYSTHFYSTHILPTILLYSLTPLLYSLIYSTHSFTLPTCLLYPLVYYTHYSTLATPLLYPLQSTLPTIELYPILYFTQTK